MTYNQYRMIFYVSFTAFAIMLIASIVILIVLEIPKVIGALTGKSARKGIAAIVQLSHGSGVTPSVGLDSIQNIMEPLMSVFIGFVMAQYVNIVGAIFAASIMMSIISNGITALNWSSAIYNVVVGAVLILIMAYMSLARIYSVKRAEKNGALANIKEVEMATQK